LSKKYPVLVTLVVPAYNVEHLIGMTLESIASQTLKSFECIIVNDFSTDNTGNVIKEFIKSDKRFKLVSHRANAGLSAARNTGLRFAKGKYVAFLDSDDLLMHDSLEFRVKRLEENNIPMVIGTYAGSLTIDMNCKVAPEGKEVKLKLVDFITAGGNCPFNANQPMFHTDLFRKIGGFDHSLKQAEDYDMWMRVLRYGYKIIPTQKQLVTYRQTEGSMIRDNPLLHLKNSYANFSNCYMQYSSLKFTNKLETHLTESLASYIAQLNIANRVLEFIGLGLAKGEDMVLLEKRLQEYLPQYFELIESHRPFVRGIKKGIDRYYKINVDLSSSEYKELDTKLQTLYQNFKMSTHKAIVPKKQEVDHTYSFFDIVGNPGIQEEIDLIFIPHKDYHVYTISLMKNYLEKQGIKFIILDISMHYRDERAISACQKYNLPYIGYSNFLLGNFKPKAFAVFNDWDPIIRSILLQAKEENIATIGIVEGIQDYEDVDTKQSRGAYTVVDYLFLPGEHDKKYFQESKQKLYVGGIPRIYDLYQSKKKNKKKKKQEKIALINSNFSYGVLIESRDKWLTSAVEACYKAGYKPIISRHPADEGTLYPELVTDMSFYEALDQASVLISRFASGILEALAVHKMPIYFNPHNEKVDKFFDSLNAYPIAETKVELVDILKNYKALFTQYHMNFDTFLTHHCGDIKQDSSIKIASDIANILKNHTNISEDKYQDFFNALAIIDIKSGCFNNLNTLRTINSEILSKNKSLLLEQKENLSLKDVYRLIKKQQYKDAQNILNQLKVISPDNPAYVYAEKTLSVYTK